MLFVDTRWQGAHGIGRFSREVLSRLAVDSRALDSRLPPWAPVDVVYPRRLALRSRDLVYSPGYNAGISLARQILTVHDLIHITDDAESSLLKRTYYRTVVRPAVLRAGVVLTVSETSRELIEDWLKSPATRVVNVGNGCSSQFSPDGEAADVSPYFMYVGNLKPHKNFDVLLEALAMRPHCQLIAISGDTDETRKRAARIGVSDQVTVLSGVSDAELATYYRGALGLLLPSTLEGFGLPAVEAMSCGTPVASWGGCPSVVEIRARTGVTVQDAGNAEEWASAMDELAGRGDSRLDLGEEWRSRYEWDSVGARVSKILMEYV